MIKMSRSARHRVHARAVADWNAGRPHAAWQAFQDAGLADEWPTFLAVALRVARRRYVTRMTV